MLYPHVNNILFFISFTCSRIDDVLKVGEGGRSSCSVVRTEVGVDVIVGPIRHEVYLTWEDRASGDKVGTGKTFSDVYKYNEQRLQRESGPA